MAGISPTYLAELVRSGRFPPAVRCAPDDHDDDGGKWQYIAAEVRAWAEGRDWRAMVAAREACAQ